MSNTILKCEHSNSTIMMVSGTRGEGKTFRTAQLICQRCDDMMPKMYLAGKKMDPEDYSAWAKIVLGSVDGWEEYRPTPPKEPVPKIAPQPVELPKQTAEPPKPKKARKPKKQSTPKKRDKWEAVKV